MRAIAASSSTSRIVARPAWISEPEVLYGGSLFTGWLPPRAPCSRMRSTQTSERTPARDVRANASMRAGSPAADRHRNVFPPPTCAHVAQTSDLIAPVYAQGRLRTNWDFGQLSLTFREISVPGQHAGCHP